MGKPKTSTTTTNTYQYMQPPTDGKSAQYTDAAAQLLGDYDGGASKVREGYARNINQINEAASSPSFYGGNTSPELMDMQRQSRLFRNNLELGRGLADAKTNEVQGKNAGYMGLAGMTAPQLVQTGGNSVGVGPSFGQTLGQNFGASLGGGLGQTLS